MTFGKLKREIKELDKIKKFSNGRYSEKDDIFIKHIIREFREFTKYLSPVNQQEFEDIAKKYKANLTDLIKIINDLIPLIQPRYNEAQRKKPIRIRTAWDKKK